MKRRCSSDGAFAAAPAPVTSMVGRASPSVARFVAINALVCGLEFSASAGFAYIPPLLLKAGFGKSATTCLMGIGPFLALAAIPSLGRWSDGCRFRYGRRWPYIVLVSILLVLSLCLVPFGAVVGDVFGSRTTGIVFTALGVVLLDFSCLIGFNPCESLVSDAVRGADASQRGFVVYSCMLSLGGCIGYLVTATDWSGTILGKMFASQEQMAFSVIVVLIIVAAITTMLAAKESMPAMDVSTDDDLVANHCVVPIANGKPFSERKAIRSASESLCRWMRKLISVPSHVLLTPVRSLRKASAVPLVLRRLFVADFCGWAALLCYYMFYTDYVAVAVFDGDPNAAEGSRSRTLYDDGVRMGSWGLLLHSITACAYAAFVQDRVIDRYGMETAYVAGLGAFATCSGALMLVSDVTVVNTLTAIAGLGFAAITTIPNTLITGYHADKELYFFDAKTSHADRGIGADIAVIDSAYVLAQILLSLVMGPLVDLSHTVIVYVAVATAFALVACCSVSRVVFTAASARRFRDRAACVG